MLKLPSNNRNQGQSFSFNQNATAPNSPERNVQTTIKDYEKYRQRNLIDFVRSRQSSRQTSPRNLQQFRVDLISLAKKKIDSMPSPIVGINNYLSTQRSIGDSIQIVQCQGLTDDTLYDEIIDLEQAIESHGPSTQRTVVNQSQQINHSVMKKEITKDGLTKINQYTILQELGKGSFGKVKLAQDNQKKYAIKICNRKKLKLKLLSSHIDAYSLLDKEIAIMKKVHHDNIVKLHEVIENPNNDKLYLVLEYMDGPGLLQLKDKNIDTIWRLFRDFMLGLEYLHNYANITHMDIKPENLLLTADLKLKIADFGVSQIMDDDVVKTKTGTSAYQPPEVFTVEQVKGKPIDVWAAGLTLYQMVYNEHPFYSQKQEQLKSNILNKIIQWKEKSDLTDLLQQMLEKDPNKRITSQQVLIHPWITKNGTNPLKNEYQGSLSVTENDIHNAITRLSFNMAIRTLNKLKQKLSQSRQRLKQKKAQEL